MVITIILIITIIVIITIMIIITIVIITITIIIIIIIIVVVVVVVVVVVILQNISCDDLIYLIHQCLFQSRESCPSHPLRPQPQHHPHRNSCRTWPMESSWTSPKSLKNPRSNRLGCAKTTGENHFKMRLRKTCQMGTYGKMENQHELNK